LNIVESFLNHDYTEEDEKDEFKVSLFHLIHLLQCNHGSETNQQILNIAMIKTNDLQFWLHSNQFKECPIIKSKMNHNSLSENIQVIIYLFVLI